jgi:uncharacterized membrane protein YphA (DoxX/SURF4 family)
MRQRCISQATFGITMIALGVVGLRYRDLVPVWNPAPAGEPGHTLLIYFASLVSFLSGIGLLIDRMATVAARVLLLTFSIWLLLFRLPNFLRLPLFDASWTVFPLLVMVAAAWVLYCRLAAEWDYRHFSFISGSSGLRIARVLYGLSLIFFGLAHFIDVEDTLSLIPKWLPGHLFWAYFTGCAFIAAGLSILTGCWARWSAALSALQIAVFLFLVWIPIVAAGSKVPFQWSETGLNVVLLSGAMVIADSYRQVTRT